MARIIYTSHPASDALARENEFEIWLERRPICRKCHQHIQDNKYYYIEGFHFCPECVRDSENEFDDDMDDGYME